MFFQKIKYTQEYDDLIPRDFNVHAAINFRSIEYYLTKHTNIPIDFITNYAQQKLKSWDCKRRMLTIYKVIFPWENFF